MAGRWQGSGSAVPADQYVARPPEASNTAPVENEHSSLASQQISAAISSIPPKRPMGILESMKSMCAGVIWSKMAVRTAAGVMQLTVMGSKEEVLALLKTLLGGGGSTGT